jgi:hypothetical protein
MALYRRGNSTFKGGTSKNRQVTPTRRPLSALRRSVEWTCSIAVRDSQSARRVPGSRNMRSSFSNGQSNSTDQRHN